MTTNNPTHLGRNIKRLREMMDMKQDALAFELGDDWNQKKVSLLEGKEEIDEATLADVAKAMGVTVDAIKNYDTQKAIFNIQNNYDNATNNVGPNFHCSLNPFDEWKVALEENRKMMEEIKSLYERLLKAEKGN